MERHLETFSCLTDGNESASVGGSDESVKLSFEVDRSNTWSRGDVLYSYVLMRPREAYRMALVLMRAACDAVEP